jgi:hypothetical protein
MKTNYPYIPGMRTVTLLAVLDFLDAPRLRLSYTGVLDAVRRELAQRGVDVCPTSPKSNRQRDVWPSCRV